jgi:hypothetical protein
MLILFDQGTPDPLRRFLRGHRVISAREQGWSTLVNGELLRVAEQAGFDLFLTTDKNLFYQQNLKAVKLLFSSWARPTGASFNESFLRSFWRSTLPNQAATH